MKDLEQKIEERLKELGKSKEELAEAADVSTYGLSKMIKRGTFKTGYMIRIQKFLGVDLSFFGMENNSGSKNMGDSEGGGEVEQLKQMLRMKDEIIAAKDEVIRTLKEKKGR